MSAHRSKTNRSYLAATLTALAMLLSACAPTPEPTPTAAFATEEEAFAAAEETYRAYNDAGNARRAGESSPNPQDYLVGTALEGDIDALNQIRELDVHLTGVVKVDSFVGTTALLAADSTQVSSLVCLDLSATKVLNDIDEDVTPPNRNLLVAQQVTFIEIAGSLVISSEESAAVSRC